MPSMEWMDDECRGRCFRWHSRVVADVRRFMQLFLRLDPTVLEWLKARAAAKGQPYQSLINDILARAMRRAG